YRRKEAVIQHGSITYDSRPEDHLAVFADSGVTVEEFEERVAGITDIVEVSREEAVDAFETALQEWADAEEGEWTDAELERAEEIADQKYRNDAWIRERDAER
ncbi:biotin/lipoate A/B protein ligase family protein, partial [Halolamina salifodinae]